MTLVIGLAIPIGAMIYSNARISDAKEVMIAKIDTSFEKLRAEIATIRSHVDVHQEKLSNQIRELKDAVHIHEVEHHHE
jgi:hypothetical protein